MNQNEWVPLLEFAVKEGISPSTVRRQIKSGKIIFRLQDGKYLIQATPLELNKPETSSSSPQVAGVLRYAEESLKSLKDAHREILTQKESEIGRLKGENVRLTQEIQELRMLIEVLEKRSSL
ncbi:MAG: hypothetical protein A3F16_04030 [Deltaproteobacteria bacterium RIFCSPHIGHO2_12_FULL_43_9]|nr:MAG: hypothetical protein A3F16_04030 [Deltaproteobacteria bacterium RIFCSPHIGHO2_12_FULL_43_9]